MMPTARFPRTGLVLATLLIGTANAGESARVILRGGDHDLGETTILVRLDASITPGEYTLTPANADSAHPASVFLDGGQPYMCFIETKVTAGQTTTYALRRDPKTGTSANGVALAMEQNNVRITLDGRPFTVYRTDLGPKPILYPLIGPAGGKMTRDYPMEQVEGEDFDHPHQRSFWFTHGKANGVDFWTELPGHGTIQETAKRTLFGGAALGVLRTTDDWLGPDGKKVCEDERVLRVYATKAARVFDFEVTIKATSGPVTLGDTKEGTFGLRVASSMDVNRKRGGKITNAEGLTDLAAWGKPSPWVDYVGPVAGGTAGVAILDHPDSFRHPTTWHVRDYGLFAANPFGLHDFGQAKSGDHTIPAGGSLTFRYRMILHPGDTAAADIPGAFRAFATPPTVEVRAD